MAGALTAAALAAAPMAPAIAAPVGVTTTVTDTAGNPIEGYVSAYLADSSGSYYFAEGQFLSDGVMNLPLEPGTYKFEFESADGTAASEYYVDKPDLATADAVAVTGPTTLAPIVLAPAPTATGRIVNSAGRPVRGGRVDLATDAGFVSSGRIDRDGTFRVGAPVAGSYRLEINASGYAKKVTDPVTLGAAPVALGDLGVVRGGVLTGRVVNTPGTGLERVRATASTASGSSYSDLTDASGVFRIENAPSGVYKVRFTDPAGEYLGEWFNDKADQPSATELALNPGATVAGIDAALANDPAATVDPATVDLSGAVVDSAGAPVIGATVRAWNTPSTPGEQYSADTAVTNRAGLYTFTDLDPASSGSSETSFKLEVRDDLGREEGQYARQDRWFGGAQAYSAASAVSVPSAGVNTTLPLAGGISGTVSSSSNLSTDGVYAQFVEDTDGPFALDGVNAVPVEEDGTYSTTALAPGAYKVLFLDGSSDRPFGPQWYDDTNFQNAKVVKVASGKTVGGIDAVLDEGMRALRKPEIKGNPYLGGKVRATSGTWTLGTGTSYSYEWLVGTEVVGSGRTFSIGKSLKSKRVTLRVTASSRGVSGTAVTQSQVIKKKPKVKIALKGTRAAVSVSAKKVKAKKFTGKVVVKKVVREDEYGAPVYKTIGKAKLRNGKASVALKKLAKGKNTLVFQITLSGGKYGNVEVTKTVKPKR